MDQKISHKRYPELVLLYFNEKIKRPSKWRSLDEFSQHQMCIFENTRRPDFKANKNILDIWKKAK